MKKTHTLLSFLFPLLLGALFFLQTKPVFAANACVSTASGNWSAAGTWTSCGGTFPGATDTATIAAGNAVTVDVDSAASSVTVNNGAASTTLAITTGKTLAVSGAVTVANPTANTLTTTVSVGAGTLTAASIAISGAATNRIGQVTVSTGTVTVTGNITFSGTTTLAKYISTGASMTNIGGSFGSGGTLTTSGTGTMNFNGSSAQVMNAYTTYNNVQINNTSGNVTLGGAVTIGGTLLVNTGILDVGNVNFTVTGATTINGTLQVSGTTGTKTFGDLTIANGGLMSFTVAEGITMNGSLTINGTGVVSGTSSTWVFQQVGGGTIGGTSTAVQSLGGATFSTNYTNSLNLTVTGTTTINTPIVLLNTSTYTAAGSLSGTGTFSQVGSSTLNVQSSDGITTLNATSTGNLVSYSGAGTVGVIHAGTFYDLTLNKSGQTGTASGAITVTDNLTISGGTLADGGFQITGNATGLLTVGAGSGLTLGSTAASTTFPTVFTSPHISLDTSSVVNYNSNVAQTISSLPTYGSLALTATATVTKTVDGALTINGSLSNGTNNTLADGGFVITVKGNSAMTGAETGTGEILISDGTSTHVLTGTGSYTNVELNSANTAQQNAAVIVNGALTITSGTWDTNSNRALTVTATTTVNGTMLFTSTTGAKTFGDIVVGSTGTLNFAAAVPFVVNGNVTINGSASLAGTGGIWTMQKVGGGAIGGTQSPITIPASLTFATTYALPTPFIVNTITVNTGIIETNAGTTTINTSLAGTGTFLQATGTVLNLAGTATVTTLDAGSAIPNDVHYTSTSVSQTAKAANYYNLFFDKPGRTGTLSGTTNILGNFVSTADVTDFVNSFVSVSGTTDIYGALKDQNNTGLVTFGGLLTIHSAGSWSGNPAEACDFTFHNGIEYDGVSFISGGGNFTFDTNNQAITGSSAVTIQKMVVTGVQLTNSSASALSVTASLSGTGEFVQGANSTLKIGGTSAITTLTASASGNSVIYNGAVTQTVKNSTYQTLDVSQNTSKDGAYVDADNSGTVSAGDTRVSVGIATFSGLGYTPGSIVNASDTDIGTAITLPTGSTNLKKTGGAAAQFVFGTDGAYVDLDASGAVSVGDIRVAVGSTVANGSDYSNGSIVVSGNTDIGTAIALPTSSTNIKKTGPAPTTFFFGRDGAYIDADNSGTVSNGDLRVSIGGFAFSGLGFAPGSTVTTGDADIGTSITLPTTYLKKTGTGSATFVYGTDGAYSDLDLNGTVSAGDIRVAVGSSIANGSNYIAGSIVIAGDSDIGTTISLPTGTNLKKTGGAGLLFVYDTINITANTTINTSLVLGGTKLYTASNKISLGSGSGLSRTSGYIVGNLQKHVDTGAAAPQFEVGSGIDYTPIALSFGSVTVAGDVTASTTAFDHADISNSTLDANKSVNRYWSLLNSGVSFTGYDAVLNFVSNDIDSGATVSNMVVAKRTAGVWSVPASSCSGTSCSVTGLTSMSDFQIGELQDVTPPTVVSIVRTNPSPTHDTSVQYIVTFSEPVTGVSTADFSLSTTGVSGASITPPISGGPTVFTLTVDTGSGDGTIRLDLLDDGSIHDTAGNQLGGAGAGNGDFTSGEVYTVDKTAPIVSSIVRADPSPTNATSVAFTVTFSENVHGVDTGDFALTTNVPGASITSVSGTSTVYTVNVSTAGGDGNIRLDLINDDTIEDDADNHLLADFTTGEVYAVDHTNANIVSILRNGSSHNNGATVDYTVTFSEDVMNVDTTGFSLTTSGTMSGAFVSAVSGTSSVYLVTVNTGSGDGTLRLDIPATSTIEDLSTNPLDGLPYTAGETYTIDKTPPTVDSITRVFGSPTNATSVNFLVTYSELVGNMTTSDFSLTTSGSIVGASVSSVNHPLDDIVTVQVNTGSGDGTIRLDMPATSTLADEAGNPISNLPFTGGESYMIDKTPPSAVSIVRANSSPTSSSSLPFIVTLSEPVSGVSASDFALTTTGSSTPSITSVTGGPTVFNVDVGNFLFDGTERLDLLDDGSINDTAGNQLGGPGAGNGGFTGGQVYVVDRTSPTFSAVLPSPNSLINSVTASSDIGYTLSEDAGTMIIFITRTGGAADGSSPHVCQVVGTGLATGAHTIDFSDTVNGCNPAVSLTDGAVYSFNFSAQDTLGNPASSFNVNNVTYDVTAPTVSSVTSAHADGAFTAGEVIDLAINFNENVLVTGGTPSIALNSGGTASYVSGSGSSTLIFRYTVGSVDSSSDLDYLSTAGLVLNGATIQDEAQNNAVVTLPSVGTFAAAHAILIDTSTPGVSAVTPLSSSSINSVTTSSDVGYTLNKNVSSTTITLTRTGGSTDVDSPHLCHVVGAGLTSGAHVINFSDSVNGCSPAVSLVDGSIYAFSFDAVDGAGNHAATVTVTNVAYDVTPPAATLATPDAGTYTSTQSVTLSSAGSTSIRYSADGSTPTCSVGTLYTGAISVSSSVTLKAVSCDDAGNVSSVSSFSYLISAPETPPSHSQSGGGGSTIAPFQSLTLPVSTVPVTPSVSAPSGSLPTLSGDAVSGAAFLKAINEAPHYLVKLSDDGNPITQEDTTVYYIGADGRRHAFPTPKDYFSWFCDFSQVKIISAQTLAQMPLGKNVTYRPGIRLVKFITVPKVYLVQANAVLRPIADEATARALAGDNWAKQVSDISDVFYGDYTFDGPITLQDAQDPVKFKIFHEFPSAEMMIPGYTDPGLTSMMCSAPTAKVWPFKLISKSFSFTKYLDTNSTDTLSIKYLQELLAFLGPTIYPEAKITGNYGPATTAAVQRLQAKNGLSQLGTVGPETRAMLNTLLNTYR